MPSSIFRGQNTYNRLIRDMQTTFYFQHLATFFVAMQPRLCSHLKLFPLLLAHSRFSSTLEQVYEKVPLVRPDPENNAQKGAILISLIHRSSKLAMNPRGKPSSHCFYITSSVASCANYTVGFPWYFLNFIHSGSFLITAQSRV